MSIKNKACKELQLKENLDVILFPKTPVVTAAILSDSLFPPRKSKAENEKEDERKDELLSTQMWRLYTKAKDALPNGSRLENLTWRMMAMSLKKKSKNSEQASYCGDITALFSSSAPPCTTDFMIDSFQKQQQQEQKRKVMINESARVFTPLQASYSSIHGTNSITIPVDMDTSDDNFEPDSPTHLLFQTSNEINHFSQSVPSYDYRTQDITSPMGLFPQLDANITEPQHYFPIMPNESPGLNAGALTFEDILKMCCLNTNTPQTMTTMDPQDSTLTTEHSPKPNLTRLAFNPKSPQPAIDKSLNSSKSYSTRCNNCGTTTTPLWRRNPEGRPLCNACGLFLKLHGVVRPLYLKTDVIKKRNRNNASRSIQPIIQTKEEKLVVSAVNERHITFTPSKWGPQMINKRQRRDSAEEDPPIQK